MDAVIDDNNLLLASKFAENNKHTKPVFLTQWNGYMVYEAHRSDYKNDELPFLILIDNKGNTRTALSSESFDILLSACVIN